MKVFCDAVSFGVADTALLMLWSLDSCYLYSSVLGQSQREVLTDAILAEVIILCCESDDTELLGCQENSFMLICVSNTALPGTVWTQNIDLLRGIYTCFWGLPRRL